MKVVISECHGGFGLSEAAQMWIAEKGLNPDALLAQWTAGELRGLQVLVDCVEALGERVNTSFSKLSVIEIPEGVDFEILDYDGWEWVAERHRRWPG